MRTGAPPTTKGPWAPFTVGAAVASGTPLHLGEVGADLARTLPAATLAAPYRWDFGDGEAALGHAVTHRYARAGLYRLTVYGFAAGPRRLFAFDAALVRVVQPDEAPRANLGYYLLRATVVLAGLTWPVDAVLVLVVLLLLARTWRTEQKEGK
jgi:hypothetical protein